MVAEASETAEGPELKDYFVLAGGVVVLSSGFAG